MRTVQSVNSDGEEDRGNSNNMTTVKAVDGNSDSGSGSDDDSNRNGK